jgi:hypothetical protein
MRAKFILTFVLVVSLMSFGFCGSVVGDNPLIGSWKWDNDKTLQSFKLPTEGSEELMRSARKAKSFAESVKKKLHSNMVLTYRQNECDQVIYDDNGHELSRETIPYRLVEVRKDMVIVDQPKNGGVGKLFRDGENSFYVIVKVDEFSYRDYFTRQ